MKKFVLCFIAILICGVIFLPDVDAMSSTLNENISFIDYSFAGEEMDTFDSNCKDFASTIRIGGYLLLFAKIALPLIIIVKATMNFLSTVTEGSPEAVKKRLMNLAMSLIAGVCIFFIPTVVNTVFGLISGYDDNITNDSEVCAACIFEPLSEDCKNYADER